MIAERYAPGSPSGVAGSPPAGRHRHPGHPTIAGSEHVSRLLGESVLVRSMLAMSFVAVALLLYLAQASQESVLQFNIAELQRSQIALTQQDADLSAQATILRSLDRVDSVATTRLHMTKAADTKMIVWIAPVVPRVPASPPPAIGVGASQRQSEPLAWMSRAFAFVKSPF